MVRKPAHVDLALEAAGVTICDLEHRYVAMRLFVSAALTEIRRLQRQLRITNRYRQHDRDQIRQLSDQIRQLMGIDKRRRHAHSVQI